jgi:hypothetical protein
MRGLGHRRAARGEDAPAHDRGRTAFPVLARESPEERPMQGASRPPMTHTVPRSRRIELLLNTLAGERYARRPLLAELIEELASDTQNPDALRASRALMERLAFDIDEHEYGQRIEQLIELAHAGPQPARQGYSA